MNIFYLHMSRRKCVRQMFDKHVVKMILEYAQLLSTCHRVIDGPFESGDVRHKVYKATHVNHPCAVWVRASSKNYGWLYGLFKLLCGEYTYRYGRVHKCESDLLDVLGWCPGSIEDKPWTPPPLAMPEEYRVTDPVKAYRAYYMGAKRHLAAWKGRPTPRWFI